ncbi:anchored repeat-type ABC transporter permease subunit [Pilimelia terevasa]|uniref:Anchored repeat-type ABC transporter permease subunit n=1 Tax=Pilimelia terevasa TaxID=53372 RepID=A0A8J3FJR0_9ACTN|nr:anchored repeat-type ABC transporter permease subunit [Pilimelia terevasa]GGK42179.1 anchored repeat-type ABC transporter permease subunit [Pilimelia terevasa]
MLDLLTEPWDLVFMQRAFAVAIMASVVCAVVGTFVVLRGMSFIGDAVAHSVFPGVAAAYVLEANLVLGGAAAGIVTALAIAYVSQSRRLKEDAVIGVFFAAAFALGIVLVSTQRSYTGDLASFLFGQILALTDTDVLLVAVVGAVLVAAVLLWRRRLVAVCLDRETAAAAGIAVARLDVLLYLMVAAAIVISVQAVGNILVLALLITPAAAARLLTDRLTPMMLSAAALAAGCTVLGLYLSFWWNLAAGGLIVLVLTSAFALCWLLSPKHGPLPRLRRLLSA